MTLAARHDKSRQSPDFMSQLWRPHVTILSAKVTVGHAADAMKPKGMTLTFFCRSHAPCAKAIVAESKP